VSRHLAKTFVKQLETIGSPVQRLVGLSVAKIEKKGEDVDAELFPSSASTAVAVRQAGAAKGGEN
jgi:hypothetical protein